jgi:hypothetical protein
MHAFISYQLYETHEGTDKDRQWWEKKMWAKMGAKMSVNADY